VEQVERLQVEEQRDDQRLQRHHLHHDQHDQERGAEPEAEAGHGRRGHQREQARHEDGDDRQHRAVAEVLPEGDLRDAAVEDQVEVIQRRVDRQRLRRGAEDLGVGLERGRGHPEHGEHRDEEDEESRRVQRGPADERASHCVSPCLTITRTYTAVTTSRITVSTSAIAEPMPSFGFSEPNASEYAYSDRLNASRLAIPDMMNSWVKTLKSQMIDMTSSTRKIGLSIG